MRNGRPAGLPGAPQRGQAPQALSKLLGVGGKGFRARGAPGAGEVPDTAKCSVFRPAPGLLWGPAGARCGPHRAAAGPCRATVGPRERLPGARGGPGAVKYEACRCQVGSLQGPKAPPRGARRPRHCKIRCFWGLGEGLGTRVAPDTVNYEVFGSLPGCCAAQRGPYGAAAGPTGLPWALAGPRWAPAKGSLGPRAAQTL